MANAGNNNVDTGNTNTLIEGITNETNSETCSETSTSSTVIEADLTERTHTFELRFSLVCRPFKLPEYPHVAMEAIRYFEDPLLSVDPRREGSEIIYTIELTEERVKHGHALSFQVEGINYSVDLQPLEINQGTSRRFRDGRQNRENSLLLTFYGAGKRQYNNVPMEDFDKAIQNDLKLTLERATERQKIRYTQVFNGNRFCVIRRPDNLAEIPEFLPIVDPITKATYHIRINYWGKVRTCGRCSKQHGGLCPSLAKFYEAKEERQRMEKEKLIKTKIVSDSTLRNADQLGLSADVMAMSGGGLGQIVQAAMDDPDCEDKSHIIIIGGTNDIKNKSFANDNEYMQNISTTIDKIYDLASNEPDKKITLVNTLPNIECTHADTAEFIERKTREQYLHTKLKETVAKMPTQATPVENVDILDVEYDVDETGHPTIEGTFNILKTLNDALKTDMKLIWNWDYITTENKYMGIQSIYKYGCNHCSGFGLTIEHAKYGNSIICDDCFDILRQNGQVADSNQIEAIRKEVRKKIEDPPLKRSVPEDEDDGERRTKMICINKENENGGEDEEMPQHN